MHSILFEIGPVTIRSYGVFVAAGFFAAFSILYSEAKRKNFYPQEILDLELMILVFGLLGARALHVLINLDFYAKNISDIFLIWRGGLAFIGGFIMAILACLVFIVKKRLPFWPFLGVLFPGDAVYRYPTQLYASFALLCIFVILKLAGERTHADGAIFTLYLALYSTQRFFLDFLRGDNPAYAFGLTVSQFLCIFIFACSGFLFLFLGKKSC